MELQKALKKMEVGQSIRFEATPTEFVKTKKGIMSVRGHKWTQKELMQFYSESKFEIVG